MNITDIDEKFINQSAVNETSLSASRKISEKITEPHKTSDNSLIYGNCQGSGSSSYACSVDFISDKPIMRCSCPSRQNPCKHALGLMLFYVKNPEKFQIGDVPEDITKKRERISKIVANKTEKSTQGEKPPTKAAINKALKRIELQKNGIFEAEKILNEINKMGFVAINAETLGDYRNKVKELGNYYIGGIQNSFTDFLINISENLDGKYEKAVKSSIKLYTLLQKSKTYLEIKVNNPTDLSLNDDIEEKIGHIWKTETLIAKGCVIQNVKLVELYFYRFNDKIKQEYYEEAYYFCLDNQKMYRRENFYPYGALKHMKTNDCNYGVMNLPEIAVYPGNFTPRIRYVGDIISTSPLTSEIVKTVKNSAISDFEPLVKDVKNILRNPVNKQNPVFILKIYDIKRIKNGDKVSIIILDEKQNEILLSEGTAYHANNLKLVEKSHSNLLKGNAICVSFESDLANGLITAKPLSILTDTVVRLL